MMSGESNCASIHLDQIGGSSSVNFDPIQPGHVPTAYSMFPVVVFAQLSLANETCLELG